MEAINSPSRLLFQRVCHLNSPIRPLWPRTTLSAYPSFSAGLPLAACTAWNQNRAKVRINTYPNPPSTSKGDFSVFPSSCVDLQMPRARSALYALDPSLRASGKGLEIENTHKDRQRHGLSNTGTKSPSLIAPWRLKYIVVNGQQVKIPSSDPLGKAQLLVTSIRRL